MNARWAMLLASGSLVMAMAIPSPVFAAHEPVVVQPAMADIVLTGNVGPEVYLHADVDMLQDVELTFDLSDVTDIATVEVVYPCMTASTTVTCRYSGLAVQDGVVVLRWLLGISPVEGAVAGSHGSIMMRASASNAVAASHRVDVVIGVDVDLGIVYSTGSRVEFVSTRAGDLVEVPLTVTARQPVHGAAVVLEVPALMRKADDFANCRYLSTGPLACWFDMVLQPDVMYRPVIPLTLRADPAYQEVFGQTEPVQIRWLTAAEYARLADLRALLGQPPGRPGHGRLLTLQPVQPASPALTDVGSADVGSPPETAVLEGDSYIDNNWLVLSVTVFARHAANFSAVVDTATVDSYGQARLRVGIKNNGPATANVPGGNANGAIIQVPSAFAFQSVPPECVFTPEEPPQPGIPQHGSYFWCPTGSLLRAGDTAWFDFTGTLLSLSQPGFPWVGGG